MSSARNSQLVTVLGYLIGAQELYTTDRQHLTLDKKYTSVEQYKYYYFLLQRYINSYKILEMVGKTKSHGL
jgi:hypothetical protein